MTLLCVMNKYVADYIIGEMKTETVKAKPNVLKPKLTIWGDKILNIRVCSTFCW